MLKRSVGFLLLAAVPLFAQSNAVVDPEAEPVLRALAGYFAQAPAFRVDMAAETHIESEDMKQEFTTRAALAVKKPDKLALSVRSSMIAMVLACDGATITTYLPGLNKYTVRPAPDSLEKISREMDAASPACLPVVSALVERDPYAAFLKQATRIRYAGRENRGDIPCHHLVFTHDEFDCDAWIRTGPLPLLEAIKPSLAKLGAAGRLPAGMKADALLRFSNWDTSTNVPDSLFKVELPADAQKTDTLIPGLSEPAEDDEEPDPSEALRLKPAPAFKLPLLGGGAFDLAAQKGKRAVVLCFWTSWAAPCRQALPVLEKLGAAFKDKGVTVLTVNPQETDEAIRDFMKSIGLDMAVALDRGGNAAESFLVAGIPQVVIVDKAGVVRDVYMGYGKNMEAELRERLEALEQPPVIP